MPLILTISQTRGGGDRQVRTLAQGSLSIGRAPGNDWVLADPDQHLSRTHCMVAFENGRYLLTDLSTNGMLVNGAHEPTTRNSRLQLTDGDTVQLGNYTLTIAEGGGAGHGAGGGPFGAANFITPRADPFASTGGGEHPLDVDPLDDPLGGGLDNPAAAGFHHPIPHAPPALRTEDPFDLAERKRPASLDEDLFQGEHSVEAWQGPAQHDRASIGGHAFTPPRPVAPPPPVNVNDIDFDDLLGDLMPTPAPHPLAPPPPKPAAAGMDSFDDLLGDFPPAAGGAAPAALPVPGPAPGPPPGPVPGPAPGPAAGPALGLVATPPVARTPVAPQPAAPPPAIAFDEDAPADAAPPAVAQRPAPPARTPPAATPSAGAVPAATAPPEGRQTEGRQTEGRQAERTPGGGDAAALLAAFAEGAGVPQLELGHADPLATMRAIGALFGAFVGGTREVLMSRAEIKHEMRVEQTMMRARDNNALKFSVSAPEALAALLLPNRPGYKPPLAAVEEAFNDIRSHEMAVMAGLQTALIALLKRFDPEALESRLQRGMLDGILPGARKARFWELFCATYKDIASEAQDDFQSIFGREFARAYDAQIRKL